jgi:GTPase SAR1 family protein
VSRSYYRGATGAILLYDVASMSSFEALPTFLMDVRALASPNLTVVVAGNKWDLTVDPPTRPNSSTAGEDARSLRPPETPSSVSSKQSGFPFDAGGGSLRSPSGFTLGSKQTATIAPSKSNIPVAVEVSALSGENVDELFSRLARMILTKIELGEIDPDDPQSGIQYGDAGAWGAADMGSVKSFEDDTVRRRKGRLRSGTNTWMSGMREWEDVFRMSGSNSRRRGGCC